MLLTHQTCQSRQIHRVRALLGSQEKPKRAEANHAVSCNFVTLHGMDELPSKLFSWVETAWRCGVANASPAARSSAATATRPASPPSSCILIFAVGKCGVMWCIKSSVASARDNRSCQHKKRRCVGIEDGGTQGHTSPEVASYPTNCVAVYLVRSASLVTAVSGSRNQPTALIPVAASSTTRLQCHRLCSCGSFVAIGKAAMPVYKKINLHVASKNTMCRVGGSCARGCLDY